MSIVNSVIRQNPQLAKRASKLLGLIEIMAMYDVDLQIGNGEYISDLLEPEVEQNLIPYEYDERDAVKDWPTSDGDEVNEMVW